jgi:hypothetical protein
MTFSPLRDGRGLITFFHNGHMFEIHCRRENLLFGVWYISASYCLVPPYTYCPCTLPYWFLKLAWKLWHSSVASLAASGAWKTSCGSQAIKYRKVRVIVIIPSSHIWHIYRNLILNIISGIIDMVSIMLTEEGSANKRENNDLVPLYTSVALSVGTSQTWCSIRLSSCSKASKVWFTSGTPYFLSCAKASKQGGDYEWSQMRNEVLPCFAT